MTDLAKLKNADSLRWALSLFIVSWVINKFVLQSRRVSKQVSTPTSATPGGRKSKSVAALVYPGFKEDLLYLARVCFPKYTCKEAMQCYLFATVLLTRTLLSLVTAEVDGYMVKQLINRDRRSIGLGIAMWLSIAVPSSLINAIIKYLQALIALSLRQRLNAHIQDLYFSNDAFYKLSHHLVKLPSADTDGGSAPASPAVPAAAAGGGELAVAAAAAAAAGSAGVRQKRGTVIQYPPNTEQAVTEGVTQWAERFADLISSLGKPAFDVVLFNTVLLRTLGWRNQGLAFVAVWESSELLGRLRPNFGQIVQDRNNLEARLRGQYTRVVTNSEEIAFYRGDRRESSILGEQFARIIDFTRRTLKKQLWYGTFEDFLTKYVWTAIGIAQVAVPLIQSSASAGDAAKFFISVRRVMMRTGDATERLIQGVKDVGELAGFTKNLMNTIEVLRHLNDASKAEAAAEALRVGMTESDTIDVDELPLYTPTNDLLIESMSLHLTRSDRLLILGPNGCGKSTLFRVLCGLWTARGGRIAKPKERTDLLFVPQRPYMAQGTLLDQVIYPLSAAEAEAKRALRHPGSASLEELVAGILAGVFMSAVVEAHGGLDAVKEWNDVLSGGEKQRVGLARVFFHKPKYAILDEVNSTLDDKSEAAIFAELVKIPEMGLITISHRHTLFQFHSKFLTYDGIGGYTYHETTATELQDMDARSQEKVRLITLIMEACKELGENWPAQPPVKHH